MHIFENEITLGNRPILDEYMNSYEYKTSGLSFSSMYMWRNINLFQWDIIGDYMCVTGLSHLELEDGISLPFLFPPLTSKGNHLSLQRDLREKRVSFQPQASSDPYAGYDQRSLPGNRV